MFYSDFFNLNSNKNWLWQKIKILKVDFVYLFIFLMNRCPSDYAKWEKVQRLLLSSCIKSHDWVTRIFWGSGVTFPSLIVKEKERGIWENVYNRNAKSNETWTKFWNDEFIKLYILRGILKLLAPSLQVGPPLLLNYQKLFSENIDEIWA